MRNKNNLSILRVLSTVLVLMLLVSIMPFQSNMAFAATNGDKENNDSPDKANAIKVNTEYTGSFKSKNDEDYFKFTVTKAGYVSATVTPKNGVTVFIDIFNEEGMTRVWWYNSQKYTTSKNPIPAGTYYVNVASIYEKTGNYSFKINFTADSKLPGASRLWGQTALDTMAAISKEFTSGNAGKTSTFAVVTTNSDYKDALAASSIAGNLTAPVLMTDKNTLSTQTKNELQRMKAGAVYIVGSTNEVSKNVVNQIKSAGVSDVIRIDGKTASKRAIEVGEELMEGREGEGFYNVIIATSKSFKDALAIAPYSYWSESPILYTESNGKLSNDTINFIKKAVVNRKHYEYNSKGVKVQALGKVLIVGGPLAVPTSVETQLKKAGVKAANISRVAGANGCETSLVIAEWASGKLKKGTGPKTGTLYKYCNINHVPEIWSRLRGYYVGVATGKNWKDALAGAALCGYYQSPLLITDGTNYTSSKFIKDNKKRIVKCFVFGGELAVSKAAYNNYAKAFK